MLVARIALAALCIGVSACSSQFEPCKVTRLPCGLDARAELPDGFSERSELIPPSSARATIVDFWGMYCEPCRRTLRAIDKHRDELRGSGVEVVAVAVLHRGDPIEPVRQAYASLGVGGSFLADWGADYARGLKVRSVPATVVVDREGRVRWLAPPGATAEDIAKAALAVASL